MENILPLESFDSAEQDERATFWLRAYICKVGDYELGIDKPAKCRVRKELVSANESEWYLRTSHQERINIIISFFDNIIIPTPPVNHIQAPGQGEAERPVENTYSKTSSTNGYLMKKTRYRGHGTASNHFRKKRNAPTIGSPDFNA